MSFFTALEVASSGMAAQRTRMNVASMNMANQNTTRTAEGGPYMRRDVVLRAAPLEIGDFAARLRSKGGSEDYAAVQVEEIAVSNDPPEVIYDPGHPDADAEGYVRMPNVDGIKEMMNVMTAARAYEASTSIMKTIKDMAERALRIGK